MNPFQRAWAYVSRKRLRSFILFLILLVLLAGISACLTLMKSNKAVETNLYKSLNTSFSIKKIENGQTFKLKAELVKVTSLDESSRAVKLTKFLSAADKSSRSTLCSPLTASLSFSFATVSSSGETFSSPLILLTDARSDNLKV